MEALSSWQGMEEATGRQGSVGDGIGEKKRALKRNWQGRRWGVSLSSER